MTTTSGEIEAKARALLAPSGILPLGWFHVEDGRSALLLGNVGGSLWKAFSTSGYLDDGLPDPLNRWTQRVSGGVASSLGADARYPFGDPVWPFQHYAKLATTIQPSPLGILIHPDYGLWVALRAALVFENDFDIPQPVEREHPCERCAERPCLSTCPVWAFTEDGYDVAGCRSHLSNGLGENCLQGGCLARRACPVGTEHAYEAAQQAFHMDAFCLS